MTIEILSGREGDPLLLEPRRDEPEGDLKEQAEKKELEKDKDKPLEPKAGLNRFLWDMRVFRPTLAPKAVFNEGDKSPPSVGPGTYQVRLSTVGAGLSRRRGGPAAPRGTATAEDLQAQFDLLSAIRDRLSETHETVLEDPRRARETVRDLGERARGSAEGDALRKRAGERSAEKLTAWSWS